MFKQHIPYTYYYAGINNLYTIQGDFQLELTNQGQVSDRLVTVNSESKHTIDGDIIGRIISVHSPNDKILCTLPLKLQHQLRKHAPQYFLFGIAEDEQSWYTKKSILETRQTLCNYQLPTHLVKNIDQYIRAENNNLNSIIGLVKTVERYFHKRSYNHHLRQQINSISTPL